MTMTRAELPQFDVDDTGALTRTVADDMTAIFGTAARAPVATPPRHEPDGAPWLGRRQLLGATAAGLVAATIAAGILVGKSVTALPTPAPTPAVGARASAPTRAPAAPAFYGRLTIPVAGPVERQAIGAGPASPATADATAPAAVAAPAAGVAAPADVPAPPLNIAAVAQRPSPDARFEPARSAFPAPAGDGCGENSEACLTERVELADQQVEEAFDHAFAAGVRQRTLRGYEREWDRARNISVERPDDSLRLFGMIASDLRNLADDVTARGGAAVR